MWQKSAILALLSSALVCFACGVWADERSSRGAAGREIVPGQIALGVSHPFEISLSHTGKKVRWKVRAVTPAELERLSEKDADLYPVAAMEILARINSRARYHIAEDVKKGIPLLVPEDFSIYKNWSPVPEFLPGAEQIPKSILIVKDIPFIGWYEYGKLVGDSLICIGKTHSWTRAGDYRVLNKDKDHVSRSYTNAYGQPAPMPWALRIYEHVWIHAGDIEKGYCSHGCINLPWFPAIELFKWADSGTVVHIIESMDRKKQRPSEMASHEGRGKNRRVQRHTDGHRIP